MYRFHLFTIKLFLLGGCRPPDPLLFLGGFQPPRPPGGGPAAPRAPLHTERLRLSGSPFFLVPRSWYQNLGSGSWYQVACRVPNVACHAVSIPFVSKSSVSCRVINLRVGVSVPCRGHPGLYNSFHVLWSREEIAAILDIEGCAPNVQPFLMSWF